MPTTSTDEQTTTNDGQNAQQTQDAEQKDASTTPSTLGQATPLAVAADEDSIVVVATRKPSIAVVESSTVPDSEATEEPEDADSQDRLIVKLPLPQKAEDKKQVERMLVTLPIAVKITDLPGERLGAWK